MTENEMSRVFSGYLAGKTIQYRPIGGDTWITADRSSKTGPYSGMFDFGKLEYRIKPKPLAFPKPKEFWIAPWWFGIDRAFDSYQKKGPCVHVREVLD